jgi:hypothetical protein
MELSTSEAAVINLMRQGASVRLLIHNAPSNQYAKVTLQQLSDVTNHPITHVKNKDGGFWSLGEVLDPVTAKIFVQSPAVRALKEKIK